MLKTQIVQPPEDADAAHTAVRPSLPLGRAAAPGGRGGLTPVSSLDLFVAEMEGLRGLYDAKVLDYDEFDRSLLNLEIRAGVKPVLCVVCGVRRASVTEGGKHICSWGVNNPNEHNNVRGDGGETQSSQLPSPSPVPEQRRVGRGPAGASPFTLPSGDEIDRGWDSYKEETS